MILSDIFHQFISSVVFVLQCKHLHKTTRAHVQNRPCASVGARHGICRVRKKCIPHGLSFQKEHEIWR